MFPTRVLPLEFSRNSLIPCSTTSSFSNTAVNGLKNFIDDTTAKACIPGNDLSISAVVSCSSTSSSSSSKKRPRSSLAKQNDETISLLRNLHPTDYARSAFKANGFKDFAAIVSECESRFLPPTAAMLEAYNTDVLNAVRNSDLEKVKSLFENGSFLHGCNACNRFGESILHIACRRGHLGMVRFLIDEVGLSCTTIRDDYHRTPLHDAFWTATANPEIVEYLLELPNVTELLLMKDKRGFTPLDYSRGEDRGKWLRFLWERRSKLRPESVPQEDENKKISLSEFIKSGDAEDESSRESPRKRMRIIG